MLDDLKNKLELCPSPPPKKIVCITFLFASCGKSDKSQSLSNYSGIYFQSMSKCFCGIAGVIF